MFKLVYSKIFSRSSQLDSNISVKGLKYKFFLDNFSRDVTSRQVLGKFESVTMYVHSYLNMNKCRENWQVSTRLQTKA